MPDFLISYVAIKPPLVIAGQTAVLAKVTSYVEENDKGALVPYKTVIYVLWDQTKEEIAATTDKRIASLQDVADRAVDEKASLDAAVAVVVDPAPIEVLDEVFI